MATDKDSALDKGTSEQPNSESSDKSNGQHNSEAEYITKTEFLRIEKQIQDMARLVQSEKDRSVKKANQRIDKLEGDIRTVLQTAVSEGKSVGDLLSQIERDEEAETRQLLRELALNAKNGLAPKSSGGTQEDGKVDASVVISELELPADDIRVKSFATRTFSSEAEAYREAAKLAKSLSKQPSDADRSSEESARKTFATQQERLMNEYTEGSKNLRGNALIQYKQAMRKKGLDIN